MNIEHPVPPKEPSAEQHDWQEAPDWLVCSGPPDQAFNIEVDI